MEYTSKTDRVCNCRTKSNSPFKGECILKGIYKATIKNKELLDQTEFYLNIEDNYIKFYKTKRQVLYKTNS